MYLSPEENNDNLLKHNSINNAIKTYNVENLVNQHSALFKSKVCMDIQKLTTILLNCMCSLRLLSIW